MSDLLAWGWLFTLPGLALTALGVPGGRRAGWASVPGPAFLLLVALAALPAQLTAGPAGLDLPGWLPFLPDGSFRTLVDPLSTFLLVVLGVVASLVYVYSLGYLADDPGRRRYFVYLDVFVAAMALLLLAGNLAVLLVGWTGVGIASFLLISFYRQRPDSLGAGLQALAANAVGDGALLLAAVLVPRGCGALVALGDAACASGLGGPELLAGLLFVAAAAKSAQGPLYFWLPSAMAGPTPISALIHAATMVAAGVYLLVRTHTLLEHAPNVAAAIAATGVATALAASLASLLQANFKRGIAYSTVAQLGYMFAAVGVGAPFAALFHLTTHAAFKALLFLSAGVVIHGMDGEERLARLSGAGRRFPFSYAGFLVGSLALIGFPFTAGAFSKDAIIERALASPLPLVGWLLLAGAFLTGLYAGRLFFRVYHGPAPVARVDPGPAPARGEEDLPAASAAAPPAQAHEPARPHDPRADRLMHWSLVPLMVASVALFLLVWPVDLLEALFFRRVFAEWHPLQPLSATGLAAAALGLAGFGVSYLLSRRPLAAPADAVEVSQPGWVGPLGDGAYRAARALAGVQTGHLPRYAFGSVLALAVILLLRMVLP